MTTPAEPCTNTSIVLDEHLYVMDCCDSPEVIVQLCVDGKVVYQSGTVICTGVELIVSCAHHDQGESDGQQPPGNEAALP